MRNHFRKWFKPNDQPTGTGSILIVAAWVILLVLLWDPLMPAVFPTLPEIIKAFGPLFNEFQFLANGLATAKLTLTAIFLSVLISFLLSYLSIIPFFRPLVFAISKARFLSLVGFVVLFIMMAHSDVQRTRVYLLMFGVVPYLTTSMVAIIMSANKSMFNYARTLGLSEWQTTWHVLIVGKAGEILEAIRQNLAIVFTMIVYVESTLREGGGIGVLLVDLRKYAHGYDVIFAVQLSILFTGIVFDAAFQKINQIAFPYIFQRRMREI